MSEAAGRAGHKAPCSNRDYDFFYEGLEAGKLLVQKCAACGKLRNPPAVACPECRSLDWTTEALSGDGQVYSYVVHHYPKLPDFATPHPVAVIALAEGVRFTAAMDGTAPETIAIDMPVRADFLRRGDVAAIRFRPA